MIAGFFSLWDAGAGLAGAPRFVSRPPLAISPHIPSVVLLVSGVLLALTAARLFRRAPGRTRWLLLTIVAVLTMLGSMPAVYPLLAIIAVLLVGWSARQSAVSAAGIAASLVTAALLTAFWWLPAVSLSRVATADAQFNSRWLAELQPIVTDTHGRWRATPLARFVMGSRQPRFVAVERYAVPSQRTPERALLESLGDVSQYAVVDHVPAKIERMSEGSIVASTASPGSAAATMTATSMGPDEANLEVAASGWALVVSNRPWWPGWRVYWNGERLPPVRVNGAFVGTFVPPGRGTLVFRYKPDALDTGIRISGIGMVVAALLLIWPIYRRADVLHHLLLSRVESARYHGRALLRRVVEPCSLAFAFVRRHRSAALRSATFALLAVYAAVLISNRVRVAGGSDSSGYLNQARMWLQVRIVAPMTLPSKLGMPASLDHLFTPLGFTTGPRRHTMVPTYPPGLPFHMALARLLGGEQAQFLLAAAAATAALLLLYLVARDFALPRIWAVLVAASLAFCPVFLFFAIQPMSDVLATTWGLASIAAARRASRNFWWGAAAGLAFGIGVLVRPTNALLLPALLVAASIRPLTLLAIACGGAVPAIVHFGVNQTLFSNPFASGYGDIRELMAMHFFLPRIAHYSYWLAAQLSPLVFPLSFAVFAVRRVPARDRLLLALWFFPSLLFYCFYGPYEEWWYTRFLLPAIPALLLALALALRALTSGASSRSSRLAAIGVAAVVLLTELLVCSHFNILGYAKAEEVYVRATRGSERLLPSDAVLVGMQLSGAEYYYTGRTMLRWDSVQPDDFQTIRAYAGGRPWYALLADFELPDATRRTGVQWSPIARFDSVSLYRLNEATQPAPR